MHAASHAHSLLWVEGEASLLLLHLLLPVLDGPSFAAPALPRLAQSPRQPSLPPPPPPTPSTHPPLSLAVPPRPQVEFILMGGTFMSLPTDYRDYFVRNLHDALSGHTSKDVAEAVRQAPAAWPASRAPPPAARRARPARMYLRPSIQALRRCACHGNVGLSSDCGVHARPGSHSPPASHPCPAQVQRAVADQVHRHDD